MILSELLKPFDEEKIDRIQMALEFFWLALDCPSQLRRIYFEMLNMSIPKEYICHDFLKARIPFPLIVGLRDLELVEGMIRYGADVNMHSIGGFKPLHMACLQGNQKMAEFLLQNGADPNAFDGFGRTPLILYFIASTDIKIDVDDCYRMTEMLVSYGAELDESDMGTMIYAAKIADLDTLMLLMNEAKGKLNPKSATQEEGESCLHMAMLNTQPGVMEYVLDHYEGDINIRNYKGLTSLLVASLPTVQNHKAIKKLLNMGADFRLEDDAKLTSFDYMIKGMYNPELAWLYFDLGYDILDCKPTSLCEAVEAESPWMKDIIAEVAKKVALGATIEGEHREVFYIHEKTWKCLLNCQEQMSVMQATRFYENVSFWDVLLADRTKLIEYSENFELVKAFFNTKCHGLFSNFCPRIRHKIIEILPRNCLIDLCTDVVCQTINVQTLYEVMQHEIMVFLKDDDFFKILGCCNKSYSCDFNRASHAVIACAAKADQTDQTRQF